MNKHTARRHRHRARQKLAGGPGAVRSHTKPGGRTGHVWAKRTHGKGQRHRQHWPNPDPGIPPLGGPLF